MAIQTATNLTAASTFYSTIFTTAFQGDAVSGNNYKAYTFVDSKKGTAYQAPFVDALTMGREWQGKKVYIPAKANKINIPTVPYEASTSVAAVTFDQDPEFAQAAIRQWVSGQVNFINNQVVAKLILAGSTTGYDGVAFASAAHPRINGLTDQSNTTSSGLSAITYNAARAAMRGFTDAAGRPLGVAPKILLVGPANEDVARSILESKDIVRNVTNAGVINGTSNVVAATSTENMFTKDGVQVVVEPLLVGSQANYWFLLGSVNGFSAPVIVNLASAPQPTDDTAIYKSGNAEYKFSIEAQMSIGFGVWQHAYCGLAS